MRLAPSKEQTGRVVVGIAELKVSGVPEQLLVTYALGSCLGVCIYDPVARVGGLLHAMLPSAQMDPAKGRSNPARFVDTGVPTLFKQAYALGAVKERIIVSVAGGASMTAGDREDGFQIGKRNFLEFKKLLWRNGVVLRDQDVGGNISRTVSLDISTGEVRVKTGTQEYSLSRRYPR